MSRALLCGTAVASFLISPTSLFFTTDGRLLVTPGCYEFRP
jgi:hypothetical protein